MERPCLILSDTHLSRDHGQSTGKALGRLVAEHRGAELILAGDIFDLSLDPARVPLESSTDAALAAHPEFRDALRAHTAGGGKITLVPGNHDAALTNPSGVSALRRALGTPDDRQVEVSSWFLRRDGVHIEHGHLYDPDNSFAHPLADHSPRTEPLGTALMRRFVAPNDAIFFAHAHRTTPASGLRMTIEKWGARAPLVIVRYFVTAFGLVGDAALRKGSRRRERSQGDARLLACAERTGLEPEVLRALVRVAEEPTHESFRRTFLRLYFDRIFAALSLTTGAGLLAAAGLGAANPASGALLSALGGGYLLQSVLREKNRYGGRIVEDVEDSAHLVRRVTGADLVILGHTHVPVAQPGYVNLGSFGFGRPERPYVLLDTSGRATPLRFPREAAA